MRRTVLLLLIFLFWGAGGLQAAQVTAHVDRTELAPGESLRLTVTIVDGQGEVDTDPIEDFRVVDSGTSTSIRIINGETSREASHTYVLMPRQQGTLTIPPLPVRVGSGTLRTQEITVRVTESAQVEGGDRDLFVRARISNPSPYVGEQIIYTFALHRQVQIARVRFQRPEFSGFTAKQIGEERSFARVVGGKRYQVTELSYVLIPLDPGAKTIEPAVLQCEVVRRSGRGRRSPFGGFFDFGFGGAEVEPVAVRTDPVPVAVRALPPYPGEGTFSGLVGRFELRASAEPSELSVGDSATLAVVLEGTGNLMDAEPPDVRVPESFKAYRDSPQKKIELGPDGYSGSQVFRHALVPVAPGEYTLPPVRTTYFDVRNEAYRTLSTDPVSLRVIPGEGTQAPPVVVSSEPEPEKESKEAVAFVGKDIFSVKEGLDVLETEYRLPLFQYLALLAAPGLFYALVALLLAARRKTEDPAAALGRRSEAHLKAAQKALGKSDGTLFSHLAKGVVCAIRSRTRTMGESLTYGEAEALLRSKGVSGETADRAKSLLERLDALKFSGGAADRAENEVLLAECRSLVRELNRR